MSKSSVPAVAGFVAAITLSSAHAGVIYQSEPNLTTPGVGYDPCSQCGGDGQMAGDVFTLTSGAVANTLSFDADSSNAWPVPVTISIFKDGGGVLGAQVYQQTFSTFAADVHEYTTSWGFSMDLVTVNLGALNLAAGKYDVFFTNASSFAPVAYVDTLGGMIFEQKPGATVPTTGDAYAYWDASPIFVPSDIGFQLNGSVPEPAAWAMMIVGAAAVGGAARRRGVRAA
jgi:hypothetical protein